MRALLAIAALVSVFVAPPSLTLVLMLLLAFRYAAWEVLFIGFLIDCMWFTSAFGFIPLFTLAGIILVWGFEPIRKEFLTR
jgi:hypothetical protein